MLLPGTTLAEVAGGLWFGRLLTPFLAFAQILLGGSVTNQPGDLDCRRNIAITLIDLIVTIRLGIPTGVTSLIAC